ncbi:hypothetical protein FRC04_003246 [Tulasnella sp. 424]|nr:hypothetical protein FRC04_003246 [Tulasnella sp. 424]
MDPNTAPMQDLIYILCHRLRSRDISLELDDFIPSGRTSSIRSFSALATAPESIRQDIHREIDESISAAREQHNASLPVNALPPELLSNIIAEVLKDSETYTNGKLLAVMSLVCRQWNRVVLNSPSLWTRLHGSDEPEYLKRAQVLSKSLGLELSFVLASSETWELLSKVVHRWQDVQLRFWDTGYRFLTELQKLGKQTASKLRKLHMYGTTTTYQPLDLFDPHDPCPLEELDLDGVSVGWDAVNFERLRYLSIGNIIDTAPSAAQLLRILERSRELEILSLVGMSLSHDHAELSGLSQPVLLPRLSSLNLHFLDPSSDFFLRMIRFPQCTAMDVAGIHVSGTNSVSGLSHIVPVIGSAIEVTETELVVYVDKFVISTSGGRHIRVSIGGDPGVALCWLLNTASAALNISPAVILLFYSNLPYDLTTWIISKLSQLQGIVALNLYGGTPQGDHCNPLDCLDKLGDMIQQAFPRLRTLQCWIDTLSELETLRQVVLRRHQAIAGVESPAVSPLQEINVELSGFGSLESSWCARFDEIQALIPGGNLKVRSQRWRG